MYQFIYFLNVHLEEHIWHLLLELLIKPFNFVGLKHYLSEAVESTNFYFGLRVISKHDDLFNDIIRGVPYGVDLILFVNVVNDIKGLIFEKGVRVSSHVLKKLFNPHPLICLHDELSDDFRNNLPDRYFGVP